MSVAPKSCSKYTIFAIKSNCVFALQGTTGKSVPGVKVKVTPSIDAHVKTPRLESGASSDNVGEVS